MINENNQESDAGMRRRAERKLADKTGLSHSARKPLSPEESKSVLHELEVHQVQLEMQNDELRRAYEALDAARESYFDLYDMAPVGYCTLSEEGFVLEANLTASAMMGLPKSELVKSPFSRFISKEDQDTYYLHSKRLFAGTGKQDFDLRILKTDGRVFWAHLTATIARESAGVPCVRVAMSDIDEQKQNERALWVNQAMLARTEGITHVGSWEWDITTDTVTWSEELFRIFQMDPREPAPSFAQQGPLYHPDDLVRLRQCIEETVTAGTPYELEIRVIRKNGEIRVCTARGFAEAALGKRATHLFGSLQDITVRKQTEADLRAGEARYRSIVDTAAEGIITTGLDGVITFANNRMAEITGYSIDELIGKVDAGLMLDRAPAEPMRSILSQYGLLSNEFEINRKDGATRWVRVNTAPLKDSSGHYITNVALFTDITDYKNAGAEQQRLREKAESSSRLAAVGEMAAGIAHEINNPLTGVIGFSELLAERQDLPAGVKEDVLRISAGSARVKEIVKRMLTFSRQTKPKKSCVNINELIEATLDLRSYVLKTANIEVVKRFDPDLHCVVADAGQMQQVFLNLIVNAEYSMKQSHGRGNLTIATEKAGEHVRISFKDDGAGMTRDTREKVFNPFFTTKGVGEGTGLGLSVTRSIILEHNGTIEVESEPGKGAVFTVILPINSPTEDTGGDSSSDPAQADKVKSGRVIVVDDEEAITSLVKAVLTREGYRVDVASDSTGASEMLDSTLYDTVLMDIRMPGVSGIDIYNDIKSRRPELAGRFIFITADASDDNTKAFLDRNELPYIVKPFDIKILLKMVEGLL